MYPCVDIKLDGILNNLNILKKACNDNGMSLAVITKLLAGNRKIVRYIIENSDIDIIGDSRVKNLAEFRDLDVEKWLIRSPMISEADKVVEYADVSLNSELAVIKALNKSAIKAGKKHKIILMLESGDLREGCYYDEVAEIIKASLMLEGIDVYGIGTNLSCLNDTLPSEENMNRFTDTVERLEKNLGIRFSIVSGGASSSINMMIDGKLPDRINNLRMGEGIFLGNVPVYDNDFGGAVTDCFILKAEIIELKDKPSVPDTFPEDSPSMHRRAIVALGKQDVYIPGLSCFDERLTIVGGSSDHIVVDVTDSDDDYRVGDIIDFKMNYNCLLNVMTSTYISHVFKTIY